MPRRVRAGRRRPPTPNSRSSTSSADSIAFQIAARVDFGTEVKQGLLELRSERERVLRLAPMLNQAADAVRRDREIRERACGNGRVERSVLAPLAGPAADRRSEPP